jgi:hypothetical protein
MTMTLRIQNLGPQPYVAEVSRGGVKVASVQPGETADVYGWKGDDGAISIVEVSAPAEAEAAQPASE